MDTTYINLLKEKLEYVRTTSDTLKISELAALKRSMVGKGSPYQELKVDLINQLKATEAKDAKKEIREYLRALSVAAAELRLMVNSAIHTKRDTKSVKRAVSSAELIEKIDRRIEKLVARREKLLQVIDKKDNVI